MTVSKQLSGRKILVVEDEWLIAEHLSMLLEELECAVVGPVATVAEALAKIEAEKIDCALLDANLNGTSSSPIVDALIAVAVPFIIVTGYGGLALPTDAMNTAPRLNKPFADYELEKALLSVLAPAAT
jgi:two-component SAPR family response regulator